MAKTDVFQILKRTLRAKGVTYRDLAKHLGLSESGVKKMFLAKDLPLGRLIEIAEWLGVSAADLVRLMENEEIAEVLKISPETVKRDWRFSRTWLLRELTV